MEHPSPRVQSGSHRPMRAALALGTLVAILAVAVLQAPGGSAAAVPFSLNLSATSKTIAQGRSDTSIQVSVRRKAGFTDRVFLGARTPSGITVRFGDNSISRFTRLTVAVSSRVKTGRYTVSVQGSSKGRTATAVLRLTVVAAGTAVTSPPDTVAGLPSTVAPVAPTTTTIISLPPPSATVPAATTPTVGPTTTTTSAAVSDFTLEAATSILPIQPGGTASLPITIRRTGGFSQPLQFSGENLPAGFTVFFSPTPADTQVTAIFTAPVSAPAGTYPVLLRALARTVAVQLSVGGTPVAPFSLTANPTSQSISPGGTANYAISVARGAAFTAPVTLSGSTTVTGVTVTVASQPDAGNSGIVTVTVPASVPAGTYTVTVLGTSTGGSFPLSLALVVGGGTSTAPALTVTPTAASVAAGTGAVFTLNLANVGTSAFAYGVSGQPAGSSVVISTTSATSVSVTVNIPAGAPNGVSTLTFNAVSGSINLLAAATLTVGTGATTTTSTTTTTSLTAAFGLSATPGSLTIARGAASATQITVTPSGGFTGTVTFTAGSPPAGVSPVFSAGSTSASTTLTVNVGAGAAVGTVPLTITGTSGALAAAIIVNLIIT